MNLDETTLLVLCGLIVVLCAVQFVLGTSFNENDPAGRFWTFTFVTGIMGGVSLALFGADSHAWWALVVAYVMVTFAVGAIWAGMRRFNRRPARFWAVAIAAVVVAVAMLLDGPLRSEWAGAVGYFGVIVVLTGLASVEAFTGRLARNLSGRVLAVVLGLVAVYHLGRLITFAVYGPDRPEFQVAFGTAADTVMVTCLVVTATISLSTLRAEGRSTNAVGDRMHGIHSEAGVLSSDAFSQAAADHMDRARAAGFGLAMIAADIDNLPEINTAFGRSAGDAAISAFAATIRTEAPVMALIGHRAAGRFLVLAVVASATEALAMTERIQTALVDNPLREARGIRMTASFGVADTWDHGHSVAALEAAASRAIDSVKAAGGNEIQVAGGVTAG
jgi:diguanylate cyclase (GGDEF)-like protein